jgi:hypothetical protein
LDVKREPPPSGPTGSRDLAVDLASMAIHGELLIYGVEETSGTQPSKLKPFDLRGIKERIDQVTKATVDEPLHVRVVEIPSGSDSSKGYLVVVVPPSPAAPHMVAGKYRGRGDTTNRTLSDAEVVTLHRLRQAREREAERVLDEYVAQDPTGKAQQHSHLFVIARPVTGKAEMALDVVEPDYLRWISSNLINGPPGAIFSIGWSPDFPSLGQYSRRARGWAVHTPHTMSDGHLAEDARENHLLELELGEDGSLKLFCGRASDTLDGAEVAFDALIVGLVKRLSLSAVVVSQECRYLGSWELAVAVTALQGAISYERREDLRGAYAQPYSDQDYRQTARATHEELSNDVNAVVLRLVGRLRRALGTAAMPLPGPT